MAKGNPGNVKRIHSAEIQLPAEILRRGFFFVDTPGLGSAIFENTKTTERFIPEIDVLILVTSYESPLSEDEMRFLNYALASVRAVFIVINKQDTVPADSRAEIIQYVQRTAHSVLGDKAVAPFSVSARDGLSAKQAGDAGRLRDSGLLDFENALVDFLANNRAQMFLSSMCDRTSVEMQALGQEADSLISQLQALQQQIDPNVSEAMNEASVESRAGAVLGLENVSSCEVCKAAMAKTMRFLAEIPIRSQYPAPNSGTARSRWRVLPVTHVALRTGRVPSRCLHGIPGAPEPNGRKAASLGYKWYSRA